MILSYDLGTGGNKASLFDSDGVRVASVFESYETLYPAPGRHEQRPEDWWNAVVLGTHRLLEEAKRSGIAAADISCLAISGHSLGCVPLDGAGRLLRDTSPIWSDSRAGAEASAFFERFDPVDWYFRTGNGFPAAHYTAFKVLWYKNNKYGMFREIDKILGTKDYINYRLTGRIATDESYASGTGIYGLTEHAYDESLLRATGLPATFFPEIAPSTEILGSLVEPAAEELGLSTGTLVACGGVDNSCMALGAGCRCPGSLYASLGSSSWIAAVDSKPLLDGRSKPYVFAHVVPGLFASALAIFSAGTSFRWLRDRICGDLAIRAEREDRDMYELMIEEAGQSPPGANRLSFNPSLGGGSSLDPSPSIRGAFLGLDLSHTRCDMIRAAMEGIALNLRIVLDEFRKLSDIRHRMAVVGGGARSEFWRQIYADSLRIDIEKINIGQDAAALGAAAIAAVGAGLWNDFSKIDTVLHMDDRRKPDVRNAALYDELLERFKKDACHLAER